MARSCADAPRVRAASRRPPFSRARPFAVATASRSPAQRACRRGACCKRRSIASALGRVVVLVSRAHGSKLRRRRARARRQSPAAILPRAAFAVAAASRSPAQRACRRGACCKRRSIASALRRAIALVSRARGPKFGRRRSALPWPPSSDVPLAQACSTDAASRAITCSSSVGTTSTATRLPSRLTVSALRAFACASSSTPSQRSRSHTAARVCG
ncbi:hypothetical protein DO66_3389 [Burkholderia pseudomallei]|nr:hypothetical protein DO66_3389 [Burkholderia pseudomallei]